MHVRICIGVFLHLTPHRFADKSWMAYLSANSALQTEVQQETNKKTQLLCRYVLFVFFPPAVGIGKLVIGYWRSALLHTFISKQ